MGLWIVVVIRWGGRLGSLLVQYVMGSPNIIGTYMYLTMVASMLLEELLNLKQTFAPKPVEDSLLRDIRMHEPVAERTRSGRHVCM